MTAARCWPVAALLPLLAACSFSFSTGSTEDTAATTSPAPVPAGTPAQIPAEMPATPAAGGPSVSGADVAHAVGTQLAGAVGRTPDEVTCPDLPAAVGTSVRCTLADGADTYGVTVTVTSVTGSGTVNFDISVDATPS